ncbi:MAG: S1C family serine protease [Planctomycetota bacterium]
MLLALLAVPFVPQEPLDAVLARQSQRVAVIDRCAQAVCSVMSMDAPGGGSGVVFDPRGFVLTNYHVVGNPDKDYKLPDPPDVPEETLANWRKQNEGADDEAVAAYVSEWQQQWRLEHQPTGASHYKNKKVGLPDGKLYEGVVLGIDPGSDLAVLRLLPTVDGQTWPYCELGNSDDVLVGETVFAMGNPFLLATDFTPTVTFGIVSGTHRYQEGQGNRKLVYPDCIQVDAPVNPGNSGGPLFNEAGEVIGINGRISIGDRGRVNVGVGFAIAANQINNFLGDLVAGRHAEHGTLDMSAWFMTARDSKTKKRGVFVQQTFHDSIVSTAGVGLGDEILTFNGIEVRSANQLATLIGVLPADTWVTLRHRPSLADGGFGDARQITVKMRRLDTGSSFDGGDADARLGSRIDRRIATAQILSTLQAGARPLERTGSDAAMRWERTAPDGRVVVTVALGDKMRIEPGDGSALVRLSDEEGRDGGFAIDAKGEVQDLTLDQRERLRREHAANCVMWPRTPEALAKRLDGALLIGGVHVHGKPGWRFALPGDGDCEAWFFHDGAPAGFAFRDPIRRAHVQWHVRDALLRVVHDDEDLIEGWTGSVPAGVQPDEQWFRRNS